MTNSSSDFENAANISQNLENLANPIPMPTAKPIWQIQKGWIAQHSFHTQGQASELVQLDMFRFWIGQVERGVSVVSMRSSTHA